MSQVRLIPLRDVLLLADAGTWGKEADSTSSVPVLRSTNIVENELRLDDVAWRTLTRAHLVEKKLASGDILVTTSSGSPDHIGKCCIFDAPGTTHPYYFSNFMLRLRTNPERANPRWLYHWLKSDRGRAALTAMNSTTSGLRNLNRALYLSQRVPLLPIADQGRIAAVLDKADEIRRKRQESLRLLDELLRSAFLEMFGNPVKNEMGWRTEKLRHIASVHGGLQVTSRRIVNNREVPYLRVANVQRGWIDLGEVKGLRVTDDEAKRARLEPGDVLVVEGHGNREEIGRSAVWEGTIVECVHQNHLIRVRPNTASVDPHFLSAFVNSASGRRQMLALGKTTSGLNTISTENVRQLVVAVPPLQLQQKYARLRALVEVAKSRFTAAGDVSSKLVASLQQTLLAESRGG